MAKHYDHIRAKAIELRTEKHMTLDQIIERLQLPRTTVYEWIKDIPIPRTNRQSEAQRKGTEAMQAKYAKVREEAYQQGWDEAPELLKDPVFRDFVVLYMGEGSKFDHYTVCLVNSDPQIVKIAHKWIQLLTINKIDYSLQYHADHDENELKVFWAHLIDIQPEQIRTMRKSNSNEMSARQWRSVHGLLSVRVGDVRLRHRLQAWMDYVKSQW
ncbi:MAG: hypothetical protein OHK0046_14880 [Anaerolineae bacterium]